MALGSFILIIRPENLFGSYCVFCSWSAISLSLNWQFNCAVHTKFWMVGIISIFLSLSELTLFVVAFVSVLIFFSFWGVSWFMFSLNFWSFELKLIFIFGVSDWGSSSFPSSIGCWAPSLFIKDSFKLFNWVISRKELLKELFL